MKTKINNNQYTWKSGKREREREREREEDETKKQETQAWK